MILLNEYRRNPARKEDQHAMLESMEQFFLGKTAVLLKQFVPPSGK